MAEATRAPHGTSRTAEKISRRYLAVALLVPVLAYLFPFVGQRIAAMQTLMGSHYGQLLDHGYDLDGTNADVVIFGDSSSLFGVDAVKVSHDLGLKVVNIPGTLGSLPITGDLTLRRYLAGNRAPKLIVFYFTAWDMNFLVEPNQIAFEGEEQVLRHGTLAEVAHEWRVRPGTFVQYPFRFYVMSSRLTNPKDPKVYKVIPMPQGTTPYELRADPLGANCAMPTAKFHPLGGSVQQLVKQYSSAGMKTMIYIAPLPDCAGAKEIAAARGGVPNVAEPVLLPHQIFADDTMYGHPFAAYWWQTTDVFTKALRAELAQ